MHVRIFLIVAALSVPSFSADFEFDKEINISGRFGTRRVNLDLGSVDLGKTYTVTLKLTNTDELPLQFEKVKTGCKCLEAAVPTDVVAPGHSFESKFTFTTEARLRSKAMAHALQLYPKGSDEPVNITFEYAPRNAIGFERRMHYVEAATGKEIPQLQVPILFTHPITAKSLSLKIEGEASNVITTTKLVQLEGGGWGYAMEFKQDFLGGSPLTGKLLLSTSIGEPKAETSLYIKRTPLVTVTPQVVHIFQKEDGSATATFLLESKVPAPEGSTEDSGSPLKILACSASKKRISAKCQKIGGRIYKASLELDAKHLAKNPRGVLSWSLRHMGTNVNASTKYVYSAN